MGAPTQVLEDQSDIPWEEFSLERLEETLVDKQTTFVDFTADWCLTCQFNKKTVLRSENVVDAFKKYKVVALRADWTTRDDELTRVIKKLGRSGVPIYAVFKNGDPTNPNLLPELLTEEIIITAIKN